MRICSGPSWHFEVGDFANCNCHHVQAKCAQALDPDRSNDPTDPKVRTGPKRKDNLQQQDQDAYIQGSGCLRYFS